MKPLFSVLAAVIASTSFLCAGDTSKSQICKETVTFAQQAAQQLRNDGCEVASGNSSGGTVNDMRLSVKPASFAQMAAEQLSKNDDEAASSSSPGETTRDTHLPGRPATFGQMAAEQLRPNDSKVAPLELSTDRMGAKRP